MNRTITFDEIEHILKTIYYRNNLEINEELEKNRSLITQLKEIDYSIKTYAEYFSTENKFVYESHGPKRIAIFLLNHFGEQYLNNATLTIYNDDPYNFSNSHINTYNLILKNKNSEILCEGNPTTEEQPYDFESVFIRQITNYPNKQQDTTKTAWDSFIKKYTSPKRSFDFKSALWTSGKHSHKVNYIIKLDYNNKLQLLKNFDLTEKQYDINILENNKNYCEKYFELLNILPSFDNLIWEQFEGEKC